MSLVTTAVLVAPHVTPEQRAALEAGVQDGTRLVSFKRNLIEYDPATGHQATTGGKVAHGDVYAGGFNYLGHDTVVHWLRSLGLDDGAVLVMVPEEGPTMVASLDTRWRS